MQLKENRVVDFLFNYTFVIVLFFVENSYAGRNASNLKKTDGIKMIGKRH